jgi:hypothetical protein
LYMASTSALGSKCGANVLYVGIVLDGKGKWRATRAEISSVAKIHTSCSATTNAPCCDPLMTGWLTDHQMMGKSPTVRSIAQVKKTPSRLAQRNVIQILKRTAKSGTTVRAVTILITTSPCNRAGQFIDVVIAEIGNINPHGIRQMRAMTAAARQISVQRSLNSLEAPITIATRTRRQNHPLECLLAESLK